MTTTEMFNRVIEKIRNSGFKKNRRFSIFLVFVGIATFFWFLRALEQEYVSHIDHPVVYQNLPDKLVLVNELPQELNLEVTGTGFAILRHNWDIAKSPIRINVRQFVNSTGLTGSRIVKNLSTNQIKNRIDQQLTELTVLGIFPDSLHFEFSTVNEKKVPVVADLDIELEKQFMIRDHILTEPDSVIIKGPGIILDTIDQILTDHQKFKKISNSLRRNLSLVVPHDLVELPEKRVVVEVPVEQFTEKTVTVPVTTINLPDTLSMKVFPAQVQLTFRVVVSAFAKTQASDFTVQADYAMIADSEVKKIKPVLTKAPALIENPRIKPELIDYLLEKK